MNVEAALQVLANVIADRVADRLMSGSLPGWIDQTASPLGARRHARLVREGTIPGMQAGRRWLARREDVDAYIASQAKRKRKNSAEPEHAEDDPAELAAELGIRLVAGGATR